MQRGLFAAAVTAASFLCAGAAPAAIVLTASGYTENFDTFASTGTSSTVPGAFRFTETGANANTAYTAGTGSGNTGDTYSFGTGSDRALGTLLSGNLVSTIFADFTNGTGQTIIGLAIAYTGEMYRLGTANRTDRLDFAYNIGGGAYSDVDALDFVTPDATGAVGARDGNLPAYRTNLAFTLSSLSIANGGAFGFRFSDFDASGADDGLAIDDFTLTPILAPAAVVPEPATWGMMLLGFGLIGYAGRRQRVRFARP